MSIQEEPKRETTPLLVPHSSIDPVTAATLAQASVTVLAAEQQLSDVWNSFSFFKAIEPEDGGGTPQHSGVLPPVPSTSMSAPLPSASPVASYTQQVASPQSPQSSQQPSFRGQMLPRGWDVPTDGTVQYLDFSAGEAADNEEHKKEHVQPGKCCCCKKVCKKSTSEEKIGQWAGTAIAGNDCASSIYYTSGLCVSTCGKLCPIALALVLVPLFLYRYIYSEVVTALPLNGGAYNVLLNVTSKLYAALASVLIILSYVATAVVSANSAASYLHFVVSEAPIFWVTLGVLTLFAALSTLGIRDSALAAMLIFFHHLLVMLILGGFSLANLIIYGTDTLQANWTLGPMSGNYARDLWYGFSTAMLGVTGFETASNFVESQHSPAEYPKVLRNIWVVLACQNVPLAFLLTATVPVATIIQDENSALDALAKAAQAVAGGSWLSIWVSVDAAIVLSGGVLTSFVGILGLVERLSRDRCLPQFLLSKNRCFGTMHWIVLCFLILTASLFTITGGDVTSLSGMYTVAFLSVMFIIGLGNLILKHKRGRLPRLAHLWWPFVLLGMSFIAAGLFGNISFDSDIVKYFAIYYVVVSIVVLCMLYRKRILRIIINSAFLLKFPCIQCCNKIQWHMVQEYHKKHDVVFLVKDSSLDLLRKGVQYVYDNELTSSAMTMVHFYDVQPPSGLVEITAMLDAMFPRLTINLMLIKGHFCPENIERLSRYIQVPKNYMFMACPDTKSPIAPRELHGIRIITSKKE